MRMGLEAIPQKDEFVVSRALRAAAKLAGEISGALRRTKPRFAEMAARGPQGEAISATGRAG